MSRPRKDRVEEYGGLLAAELRRALAEDVTAAIGRLQEQQARELAELRRGITTLQRRVELLLERERGRRRIKLGRWVPGGPGRPPKDAADRIAAFSTRPRRRSP